MADPSGDERPAQASIVIPAHNEARTIGRLLTGLLQQAQPGELDIVVVCNGCTDKTADVARRFGPDVRVVEIAEPSKQLAMRRGDKESDRFPRLYVDADVQLTTTGVRALCAALGQDRILAAGPDRVTPLEEVSRLVRAYQGVWERLPQVRAGLFGRGVIAVSAAGYARISGLPPAMSDDLAISEAFAPHERTIVAGARVVVHPPRTMADLLRRRIRVTTGNAQLDQRQGRSGAAKTSLHDLARIARANPSTLPGVVTFLAVAVVAKLAARRRVRAGDFTTWLRAESSRSE